MTTFILTWDGSDAGYPPGDFAGDVERTATGELAPCRWSVGATRGGLAQGERVFLLRQGTDRGLLASGRLDDGTVFEELHWEDANKTAHYVNVLWDRVLPLDDRLSFDELKSQVPLHHWDNIFASGQRVHPPSDAQIETAWARHLDGLGRVSTSWTLPVGETLGRRARVAKFGGAMYGGIEPSKSASTVFIYSDPRAGAAYGYDYDGWSSDGSVFLYTGEGRRGHQRMRGRNAAILNHDADGRKLRLFVADGTEPGTDTRIQRYLGEFQVSPDEPFVTAEAPDVDGNQRTVIVFRLTPKGDFLQRDEDASPSGDVSPTPSAEAVSVEAAETPAGSADPVPVEALGSATYPLAGSTATVAVKWEAELVARYQVYLEGQGSVCVRYKLRPPGELSPAYSGLCRG